MKATDWLIIGMVVLIAFLFIAVFVAFVVGAIQCSAAGWDDGTWYVTDTLCKNIVTEKLSIIRAGQ